MARTQINYSERLKNPRWQRKRLEILQRDNWECQCCGNKDSTLVVHHRAYKDRDPWDYPDCLLVTLCEICHQDEMERGAIEDLLIHTLRTHFLFSNLSSVNDAFGIMPKMDTNDEWMVANILEWMFSNPEIFKELNLRCWSWMRNEGDSYGMD